MRKVRFETFKPNSFFQFSQVFYFLSCTLTKFTAAILPCALNFHILIWSGKLFPGLADWTMDRDDQIHSLIDVGEVFWYQLNSKVLEKDRFYEGKQRQSDG